MKCKDSSCPRFNYFVNIDKLNLCCCIGLFVATLAIYIISSLSAPGVWSSVSCGKDSYIDSDYFFFTGFWKQDRIKAFLSKVPDNKMIILDLNSEASPVYTYTNSYYGKPYIWCLLHNYGGQRGIYGNLTRITTGPIEAKRMVNSTMIGTGITPEAIEHNPVVFDLMVSVGLHNYILLLSFP